MLNCRQNQNKVPQYAEDLLSESDRRLVREHLGGCEKCRAHAARHAGWASDLKKLNEVRVPFDLGEEILKSFHAPPASAKLPRKTAVLGIVLCAAIAGGYFSGRFSANHKPAAAPSAPAAVPAPVPPAENEKAAAAGKPRPIENLHPLRWDIEFKNAGDEERFLAALGNRGWPAKFYLPEAPVYLLDRQRLAELVALVHAAGPEETKGVFKTPEAVPVFLNPVRVTLLPKTAAAQPGVRRMEARFVLPNFFSLQENLEQMGFKFLYAADDLWVLEIAPEDYDRLRLVILDNPATTLIEDQDPGLGPSKLKIFIKLDT